MGDATSRPFDLVLGRRTYDIFAAHWPHTPEEDGGKPFNDATKDVASRSHSTLEWSNSILIEGDAAEGIRALKAEDGPELQVHGSGDLIQTLLRHDLVDQYRLWVFPLMIGSSKRLFSLGTIPAGLKLLDTQVSTTGVVMGTYEPAAEVLTGSSAVSVGGDVVTETPGVSRSQRHPQRRRAAPADAFSRPSPADSRRGPPGTPRS